MELYKQYLKEIGDIDLVVEDSYFFTYQIQDNSVYLENVFIKKELRNNKKVQEILERVYKICREYKKPYTTSTVCKNANKEVISRSSYILKRNGFIEFDEDDNMIYFSKEINNG
jgi:hypothetical protein